jgi:hypothetical protein
VTSLGALKYRSVESLQILGSAEVMFRNQPAKETKDKTVGFEVLTAVAMKS